MSKVIVAGGGLTGTKALSEYLAVMYSASAAPSQPRPDGLATLLASTSAGLMAEAAAAGSHS